METKKEGSGILRVAEYVLIYRGKPKNERPTSEGA